jgi:hypothetical protein
VTKEANPQHLTIPPPVSRVVQGEIVGVRGTNIAPKPPRIDFKARRGR